MEMKKSELTHGSLFSGIGGPEIAAEIMGWKNVFHCEINPFGIIMLTISNGVANRIIVTTVKGIFY